MNVQSFITCRRISCLCAFISVFFLSISALGQAGRGSITGTVTDPTGALVPGAKVTLLDKATGVNLHTVTSAGGLYSFISLNPGLYEVTASQTGFASVAVDNITVNVDQVTQANVTLKVGATTEAVTVTSGVSLVEPTSSTVGTLISAETIDRVPLLYRNVYDLAQLSAGVTPPNGSPNSSDSMQSVQNISIGRPGVDISSATINGAIVGSVYYMLDGSPIGVAENNAAAIIPAMNIPEDGIDEVRVETQNTPASYQSGGAGVISLVSKSGTNKFHGDVFGVFRPNALSANEYFNKQSQLSQGLANTPPDFHRYQEGASIGGPIKKDKLFFFADYEHTDQIQFEGLDTFAVPTTAEKSGDFSNLLNDPSCAGSVASCEIFDPTKPDNSDGTRQAFPGNIIPNPNPIGLLYLSKMPHCNIPDPVTCDAATTDVSPNYEAPGLDPFKANRFDVRVDWAASEKQRIFTRFSYDKLVFSTANVFPSGWDLNYAQNVTNGRNILVADDVTLNSSTVLQLRYSFTRHHEQQGGPPSYSSIDITNLGTINGATVGFPASLAAQQVLKQLPFVEFNDLGANTSGQEGVGGTSDYNNFLYASMNSDANAAITKIHGKHEISFGFEWMKRYLNVGQPPAPAGSYGFDLSATDQQSQPASGVPVGGSDFASLLVGMGTPPGTEINNSGYPNFTRDVFAAESNPYYATFVEDTYHARKTLTITAGLRWDIFGGRNERYNRQEYFNPTVMSNLNGVPFTGAEIYVNGSHRSPFTTNMHDFGPRLAFAWQPINRFVVRGGAGIYYGPSTHQVSSALQNTDGFSSQTQWNGTCYNADGNTVFTGTACNANTGTPVDNFTVPYSLSNPFPTGTVPIFTTGPSGLANNFGTILSTVLPSQRTPTTYNYNFAVEYELPHAIVVTAGYVGSRGLFLPFGGIDFNVLSAEQIQHYGAALCVDPSNPQCQMVPNTGPVSLNPNFAGAATVPLWAVLQAYPQYGDGSYGIGNGVGVNGYQGGDSSYNSLQTKVQKRLANGFTTLSTFTWGKIMTDDGNPPLGFVGTHLGAPQDWRDLQYEHSISPQDVKYQFTSQVSYDLPVGKGKQVNLNGVSDAIAGGWTVNAIVYLSTGVPINSPLSGLSPAYLSNQRADMVCNPASGAPHTVNAWFNDNCFVQPGAESGTPNALIPGTAPAYLDNVRTRGARDLDLSIYKAFKIGEARELRFDVSAYNVTNTAQYGYPSVPSVADATPVSAGGPGSPFGQITNTVNTPRQFQFGARFTF
ncbi:MAG TPA: carboxypeptidase regulatory-like domain-containing protein [Terriglobales bacterium]|nr:carboxypeptidase regulatory-like domain-containing protein [Terriglobales bacterium]